MIKTTRLPQDVSSKSESGAVSRVRTKKRKDARQDRSFGAALSALSAPFAAPLSRSAAPSAPLAAATGPGAGTPAAGPAAPGTGDAAKTVSFAPASSKASSAPAASNASSAPAASTASSAPAASSASPRTLKAPQGIPAEDAGGKSAKARTPENPVSRGPLPESNGKPPTTAQPFSAEPVRMRIPEPSAGKERTPPKAFPTAAVPPESAERATSGETARPKDRGRIGNPSGDAAARRGAAGQADPGYAKVTAGPVRGKTPQSIDPRIAEKSGEKAIPETGAPKTAVPVPQPKESVPDLQATGGEPIPDPRKTERKASRLSVPPQDAGAGRDATRGVAAPAGESEKTAPRGKAKTRSSSESPPAAPAVGSGRPARTEANPPAAEIRNAPQADPPPVFEQVGLRISPLADGVHEVEIRLVPDHLGRLKIDLKIQEGRVDARLQADNDEARAVLAREESALRESLSAGGITLSSYTVTLGGDAAKEERRAFRAGTGDEGRTGRKRSAEAVESTGTDETEGSPSGERGAAAHWIA
jgi:hypothetical protein